MRETLKGEAARRRERKDRDFFDEMLINGALTPYNWEKLSRPPLSYRWE